MPVYQYRATDFSGKVLEGTMEADQEQGVVARIHEMGLIPLRVTAAAQEARSHAHALLSFAFKQKVTQRELLYFTWELGTLLTAGLPLDRSLSVLSHLVQGERREVYSRSEEIQALLTTPGGPDVLEIEVTEAAPIVNIAPPKIATTARDREQEITLNGSFIADVVQIEVLPVTAGKIQMVGKPAGKDGQPQELSSASR